MKLFLQRIIIFLSVFLGLLLILEVFITQGLKKTGYNEYKDWNLIFQSKINSNVLIQGDSRAWVQISPKIIDSVLHVQSYNLGIDGHNFKMQQARYQIYRKYNSKPKMIIQILGLNTLRQRKDLYNSQQFLPFIWDKDIRNCIMEYEGFNFGDYYIPAFRYLKSNLTEQVEIGFYEFLNLKHYENTRYKGFRSRTLAWDSTFAEFKKANPKGVKFEVSQSVTNLLDKFVAQCVENKIDIVLVYAPEYIESQSIILNRSQIIQTFASISKKYNVLYMDYSSDSICFYKKYFYNSQHLNSLGADLFSKKLATDLKNKMNK
jgi:hypothetical protein